MLFNVAFALPSVNDKGIVKSTYPICDQEKQAGIILRKIYPDIFMKIACPKTASLFERNRI